jgi:hypothetical protein
MDITAGSTGHATEFRRPFSTSAGRDPNAAVTDGSHDRVKVNASAAASVAECHTRDPLNALTDALGHLATSSREVPFCSAKRMSSEFVLAIPAYRCSTRLSLKRQRAAALQNA